jgi:hypothetical protein
MTTIINTNKINNVIFFNPRNIKDNEYKKRKCEILMDESDLEVYPKEETTEKQRQIDFKKFKNELYKEIRSTKKFCEGLQASFVKDSLSTCDFVLRVESSQTRSKKINGFATLKILKSSKSLYVDVICTNTDIKGTGTYMVNLLSKICKLTGLEAIKLSATESAVPFYLKTHFECDPLCKMKKEITGGSKTRKNNLSCKSRTRRIY